MKTSHFEEKKHFMYCFLQHAKNDGWRELTIKKSALEMNLPENYGYIFFPKGFVELKEYFEHIINEQLAAKLDYKSPAIKLRDFVSGALYQRFVMLLPYKESLRTASYSCIEITQVSLQVANLIWCKAQDKSLDFNYYSKRAILAAIYARSFNKFFTVDGLEGMEEFLSTEIAKVLEFEKIKHLFKTKLKSIPFVRLLYLK